MNKFSIILSLVLLMSFVRCNEKPVFNIEKEFENNTWTHEEPLEFGFDITDTTTIFNLDLFVKHTTEYSFQNIYLKAVTTFPDGKKVDQLFPVNFADRFGKWYGKCSGDQCKLRIFLQQNFRFEQVGTHIISLIQESRESELEGIISIQASLFEAE